MTITNEPSPGSPGLARAEACANIALAKYWGKSARGGNLTAVPSLSMTLDALRTRTEVSFSGSLGEDELSLNGVAASPQEAARVITLLDRVRTSAKISERARVTSLNNFPTAAGLASSASGFAALAVAASYAAGLRSSCGELSSLARQSSASAGRSVYGGFVELLAESDQASSVPSTRLNELVMLVLVTSAEKKPMGSTLGMNHTSETSPVYGTWLEQAPLLFGEAKAGLLTGDFNRLANAMEDSTRLMHATMMTARPPLIYLRPATIELMHEVSLRREQGYPEAYTMDAGPNVKLLTRASHLPNALAHYEAFLGVERVIVCRPGPGAARLSPEGELMDASRTQELS